MDVLHRYEAFESVSLALEVGNHDRCVVLWIVLQQRDQQRPPLNVSQRIQHIVKRAGFGDLLHTAASEPVRITSSQFHSYVGYFILSNSGRERPARTYALER